MMKIFLQALGAFFLFSWVMTIGSCMVLGGVATHVASRAAADAERTRTIEAMHDLSPVATETSSPHRFMVDSDSSREIVPGQPMLDPTPPGEHHHY